MLTKLTLPAAVATTNNYDHENPTSHNDQKPSRKSLDYQMEKPIPAMSYAAMNFAPKLDWANQIILGQKANIGGDYIVAGPLFPSDKFVEALKMHRMARQFTVQGVYVCKTQQEATEVLWSLICAHFDIK